MSYTILVGQKLTLRKRLLRAHYFLKLMSLLQKKKAKK